MMALSLPLPILGPFVRWRRRNKAMPNRVTFSLSHRQLVIAQVAPSPNSLMEPVQRPTRQFKAVHIMEITRNGQAKQINHSSFGMRPCSVHSKQSHIIGSFRYSWNVECTHARRLFAEEPQRTSLRRLDLLSSLTLTPKLRLFTFATHHYDPLRIGRQSRHLRSQWLRGVPLFYCLQLYIETNKGDGLEYGWKQRSSAALL